MHSLHQLVPIIARLFAALALALSATATWGQEVDPEALDDDESGLSLSYIGDVLGVVEGGLDRGVRAMGRFDASFTTRPGFLGLDGAVGYVDVMALHGGGLTAELVGDAQVVSNIDADPAVRILEAWLEASVADAIRLKAGFIDLNSEFDLQPVGATFLNSSFGIAPDLSQTGDNGPSIFPVTSFAGVVALERDGLALRLGVFDAVSGDPARPGRFLPSVQGDHGALLIVEGDVAAAGGEIQLGGWRYTSEYPRIDGGGTGPSQGAYMQYERPLARTDRGSELLGWVRAGAASSDVNPIGTYLGGGLRFGTDEHHFGLGVAHARRGDPAIAAEPGKRSENVFEATTFHALSDNLAIQPDLQYVVNPTWAPNTDALVVGVRLHLSH